MTEPCTGPTRGVPAGVAPTFAADRDAVQPAATSAAKMSVRAETRRTPADRFFRG
jgi:hypothetical protein